MIHKRVAKVGFMRYVQWTRKDREADKEGRLHEPCLVHSLIDPVIILLPHDKGDLAEAIRNKSIKLQREVFICPDCKWEIHQTSK